MGIRDLLLILRRMKVTNLWRRLASNIKACFVESRLAMMRASENMANERQSLRIVDSLNSDCVQYMIAKEPIPKRSFTLPPAVEKLRQSIIANQALAKTDEGIEVVATIKVAIYGYNSYVREIIESLKEDVHIELHLVTKSVIESRRAELDNCIITSLISEIISIVDFWLIATIYDDVTDFRNQTEANLEFVTHNNPIFSQKQYLQLKDGCYIASMCNFTHSLALVHTLEMLPQVQFALYPQKMTAIPKIIFTRQKENKIAKMLHKVIRKRLKLPQDCDERGRWLGQPDCMIPEYTFTMPVSFHMIADRFFDMPC